MHIEPGVVEGSKIVLSYATSVAAIAYAFKLSADAFRASGALPLLLRGAVASVLVLIFFEVFPHQPVGVSEVHLILGSTLLLLFGVAPAAIGLMGGLLLQGLFFAPSDLPQFGMNVTSLLVPLFVASAVAERVIPAATAYVDISYAQALKLSLAYQGGIATWVGFWALYGQGFATDNLAQIALFGAAYMTVVIVEPLVDLAVLAGAKVLHQLKSSSLVQPRLFDSAA